MSEYALALYMYSVNIKSEEYSLCDRPNLPPGTRLAGDVAYRIVKRRLDEILGPLARYITVIYHPQDEAWWYPIKYSDPPTIIIELKVKAPNEMAVIELLETNLSPLESLCYFFGGRFQRCCFREGGLYGVDIREAKSKLSATPAPAEGKRWWQFWK